METQSKLGEILGVIGSALGRFGLWSWEMLGRFGLWCRGLLGRFFSWMTVSVSEWFSSLTLPMMPTILKIFSNETANLVVFFVVVLYILFMNIAAFIMYGSDKRRAETRRVRRISERALLRVCFWGGAFGGLIGMQIFRHKTLKTGFKVLVPIMFVIQLVLDSFVIGFLAFWAFF